MRIQLPSDVSYTLPQPRLTVFSDPADLISGFQALH